MNKKNVDRPELEKSEVIQAIPLACADETTAVEFFEKQRWGNKPLCVHCQSDRVYKMVGRNGSRNSRYLWRCRECNEQYTVRFGTIYEDSRLPLRHWCYAFWRACTSKKGVSALEIQRHCEITYKSALFLMHRVRFAMAPDEIKSEPLGGTVECDETFVGGKPRPETLLPEKKGYRKGSSKTPVLAVTERGGDIRTKVVVNVTQQNLRLFLAANASQNAMLNTDQCNMYVPIGKSWKRHDVVNHSIKEYARKNPDGSVAHVNTCESFFSLLKRGLIGTFHAVSKEHLHRYCDEFSFRWNNRKINDGDRVALAIKSAIGKRLLYDDAVCRA